MNNQFDFEEDEDFDEDDDFDSANSEFLKKKNEVSHVTLFKPIVDSDTSIGESQIIVSSPQIVHFGQIVADKEYVQTIHIINKSSKSQRFSIAPPSTKFYKFEYIKCGSIAPGMSQKVTIKFTPKECKYYYDAIRVRGDTKSLLVPIHGYPISNNINFPREIHFGHVPICEHVVKVSEINHQSQSILIFFLPIENPVKMFHSHWFCISY
jgi:hypothetical protein